MKSIRSVTLLKLAMGSLLAVCFNSGLASAQTLSGKFTLPFEARWGLATLPPGDYSFTLDGTGPDARVRVFRGPYTIGYVMSQSHSLDPSGAISLTVVQNSAGKFVRDLNLPELGMVLHYAPHNSERGSEREIAHISVKTAGK